MLYRTVITITRSSGLRARPKLLPAPEHKETQLTLWHGTALDNLRRGSPLAASGRRPPIDLRNVTRAFKAVLKTAEMPMIRLHDLRHSWATLLLAQGVTESAVLLRI